MDPVEPFVPLGDAVTNAGEQIAAQLGDVSGPALIIGGGLLAVGIGWRFVKRFIKG